MSLQKAEGNLKLFSGCTEDFEPAQRDGLSLAVRENLQKFPVEMQVGGRKQSETDHVLGGSSLRHGSFA